MNALIIPGHNSHADKPRFLRLAQKLKEAGWHVESFNAQRQVHRPGEELVLSVTAEYAQAKQHLERLDRPRIALGHSQGGPIALRLAHEGVADAAVSLMGDVDPLLDEEHHLENLGLTLDELREQGFARFERDSGQANWYTAEFFEDYRTWDIPALAADGYPKLFIAGEEDVWNTPQHIQALFEKAADPKMFVVIQECPHNFEEEQVDTIAATIRIWAREMREEKEG